MKRIVSLLLFGCLLSWITCLTSCNEDLFNIYYDNFRCEMDSTSEYIIVLGDIQEYTQKKDLCKGFFIPSLNWIRSMAKHGYMINSVLQTGDLTNNNQKFQYSHFKKSVSPLADELLYVSITGNHDYDWDDNKLIHNRRSSKVSKYASFTLLKQSIEAQYEKDLIDNMVVRHYIHGERYDILCLEFAPRPEVVEWANQYVSSHRSHNFILLTHEMLDGNENMISDEGSHARSQFESKSLSCTPQYVWNHLIRNNDNIRCVLCGHRGFSQFYDKQKNDAGRNVPQILFNIQDVKNGGNGLVEVWEIPQDCDSVHVRVYNTMYNTVYNDSTSSIINAKRTQFSFAL